MVSGSRSIHEIEQDLGELLYDRPADANRLADLRQRYANDPEAFLREVLHVDYLWDRQLEMLEVIEARGRVAVVTANGVGKTWVAARYALHYLYTHESAQVIVLGPGARQLRLALWTEVREALEHTDLPGKLYTTLDHGLVLDHRHRLLGFSTAKGTGIEEGRLTGEHAENMLVIVEEAHAVEDWVWRGVARLQPSKVLAIGNAGEPFGSWFERCSRLPDWTVIQLSALQHPNVIEDRAVVPGAVERRDVEEVARTFGRDSAFYKSTVLGEFTHGAPDALISPDLWQAADARWRCLRQHGVSSKAVCAWDVAGETGVNAVAIVHLPLALPVETWTEPSLRKSAHEVKAALERQGLRVRGRQPSRYVEGLGRMPARQRQDFTLLYDAVGVGFGAGEALQAIGMKGTPFKGSEVATALGIAGRSFVNRRIQSYFSVRTALLEEKLATPWSEALVQQGSIRFGEDLTGRITLEPKRDLASRIGGSPNELDALAMAVDFALEKQRRSVSPFVTPVTWSS